MSGLCFLDTNILIYAQDGRDPRKQKIAAKLIEDLAEQQLAAISTQVIQEFCNVLLKPDINLPQNIIIRALRLVLYPLVKNAPNFKFYEQALGLHEIESISFYDAMIIQAAIDLGCKTLYSEDLQDGRVYGGITVKNPFKAEK